MRNTSDQQFLRDVQALSPITDDGWYRLALDDANSDIGLMIKIERYGERSEIVGYTTYNR